MDKIMSVIYYTIKRGIRDRTSLMEMMLFPIVLILILGTALNGAFEPADIAKVNIGYSGGETSVLLTHFEDVIRSGEIDELVEAKNIRTYEEGIELLEKGEISAFIFMDENSSDIIEVYKGSNLGEISTAVIETIMDSFSNGINTGFAVATMGGTISDSFQEEIIEEKGMSVSGRRPDAMDYYSVTMLVMFMLYGANYGVFLMADDYLNALGMRIKASPIKPVHHFVGKTIGIIFTVFSQSIVIVLFTKYVYAVNWGENLLMIGIIILVFSILTTGFGVMLCMITRKPMKASGILNIIVPITTFLSGGYFQIPFSEGLFRIGRYFSPNYLAQTAIFNVIYEGSSSQTYIHMGGIVLIILITFTIAGIAGRRNLI